MHLVPRNDGAGHFNVLRGAVGGVAGTKVVGDFVANYAVGLPSELGLLTLYDPGTGVPLAEATALGGTAACCGGCEPLSAIVDRSSGAPAARPPGAPTGGTLSWIRSGVAMTA